MSPAHLYGPPSGGAPSKPRPSASLIVINNKNEILLVCRAPRASIYAGAHVFPGGNYDSRHDSTFADTAVRETFEETGLLLATSRLSTPKFSYQTSVPPHTSDHDLDIAREAIHCHKQTFKGFLSQQGLKVDEKSLFPFSQWVTPPNYPKRFQTQFYVFFLGDSHSESSSSSGFSSGHKHDRVPAHDGGQEVIEARFVHPLTAIQEFREKKITLLTPQFYLIVTLSEILTTKEMTSNQRARILELSDGLFGKMCLHPLELVIEDKTKIVFTYEGDESRGGKPGCLHRNTVRFNEARSLTTEDVLERDFDIFTEIDPRWWQTISKL